MENNNNQQSFWQFSDQLRVHTNNLANLSLNDSIWGNSYPSKRPEERKNFDIRVGGEINSAKKESDRNGFNQNWKVGGSNFNGFNQNPKEASDFNQNWKVGGSDFNGFNQNLKQESDFNQNWKVAGSNFNGFNLNSKEESDLNGFNQNWKLGGSDFNGFNQNWKVGESNFNGFNQNWKISGLNDGFNKGVYSKPSLNFNNNDFNVVVNTNKGNKDNIYSYGGKSGKKNKNNNNSNNKDNNNNNNSDKNSVEKRFKTLPPAESLPRNEAVGGYIFVCNNETMEENLERQLFGLPPRYRDSVRAITPGLPLFLYNYSTHQLHGIFEAASFGASNIDPMAWEDKKNAGESRFPAQVRVVQRKICEPLEEDSFRPILHHYDGPKFRLELSIHEALSLLDIFANASLLDIFEESNP